jgi:hypothetical protein
MNAINRSKEYFFQYGLPMLEKDFPEVLPYIAAGLTGFGSESLGYDDEYSYDHDTKTGFMLFLDSPTYLKYGSKLTSAYTKLLKEHPPYFSNSQNSLMGQSETGVQEISNFLRRHIALDSSPQNYQEWLYTPEYAFLECINGEIFLDNLGTITSLRQEIANNMPQDVRLKKLAARAAFMAQYGQYNYARCLKHKEVAAAKIALSNFIEHTVGMVFLLNNRYTPYYKWMFRALKELPILNDIYENLEFLLCGNESPDVNIQIIEDTAAKIIAELHRQNLTQTNDSYLEHHAVEITRKIQHSEIAQLHIISGV